MKIPSINIRGLSSRLEKERITSLIREEKVDFIAIQETKLSESLKAYVSTYRATKILDGGFN